jgi:hypothetical protein
MRRHDADSWIGSTRSRPRVASERVRELLDHPPLVAHDDYVARSSALAGAAGEYFVAAQLSRIGWNTSLLFGGAPRNDLLAVRDGRAIAVQVKTSSQGGAARWNETVDRLPQIGTTAEYIALVELPPLLGEPFMAIVPRTICAYFVWSGVEAAGGTHSRYFLRPRDFWWYGRLDWLEGLGTESPFERIIHVTGGFWSWQKRAGPKPEWPQLFAPDAAWFSAYQSERPTLDVPSSGSLWGNGDGAPCGP